ncbi:hypothetical protein [Fulvivirga ligni]|uniref:hypothetical protein n=1 Tax=Fulvivirga ligni TaxID=2904246 RepID=UPI001F47E741|nr:hypothetical protein [Fulvivirga ligni]UII19650.1 hypothetical protein LVD16_17560 [Fulvivirga ligni]
MSIVKKVEEIFNIIEESNGKIIPEEILKDVPIKYHFNESKYPQLLFQITRNELKKLEDLDILKDEVVNFEKADEFSILEKLLLSILWKQGDLGKERHLVKGIQGKPPENNRAVVFQQFGRHLCDRNEPIIDQHVIRAFRLARRTDEVDLNKRVITWDDVNAYQGWIEKHEISDLDTIDKILFALGKWIKNEYNDGERNNNK